MSMTNEKAEALKKELLQKGEEMLEAGKVANEELKHNLKEKMKENVTVVVKEEASYDKIKEVVTSLSKEEKQELMDLLKEDTKEDKKTKDEK